MDPWRMEKLTKALILIVLYSTVVSVINRDYISLAMNLASLFFLMNPIIRV